MTSINSNGGLAKDPDPVDDTTQIYPVYKILAAMYAKTIEKQLAYKEEGKIKCNETGETMYPEQSAVIAYIFEEFQYARNHPEHYLCSRSTIDRICFGRFDSDEIIAMSTNPDLADVLTLFHTYEPILYNMS